MKVKVIKRAERESLGDGRKRVPKTPKRRRIARTVEKWIADVRDKADAEDHISLDELFHTNSSST